jgi:hypothetical protein
VLETLQGSDFTGHLNQHFSVTLAEGDALELQLVEVTVLGAAPAGSQRQPFSLVFRHDRTDAYLPQGIYTLRHAEMGRLALFLVPLGPAPDGMRYEAIFA